MKQLEFKPILEHFECYINPFWYYSYNKNHCVVFLAGYKSNLSCGYDVDIKYAKQACQEHYETVLKAVKLSEGKLC